jgi:hypothetical protein
MMQREDGPIPEKYTLWKAIEEEGVQWLVCGEQAGLLLLIEITATGMQCRTRVVGSFVHDRKLQNILTNLLACLNLMKQAVVSSQMKWEWARPCPY